MNNLEQKITNQPTSINRISWIDASRLIAMFGVILIHIAGPVFHDYRTIPLHASLTANAINSLARVSVPLFIMLSGSLLLGKDTSISVIGIGERIFRVLLPLIFWSYIYVFWLNYWTGESLDFFGELRHIGHTPVMYHLWFIYMIIGVYILLPILRVISNALISNRKLAIYFFALWFVVNSITIYYPIALISQLNLSNFLSWPGNFMLGYYLTHSKWLGAISWRLNAFVFFFASLCTFCLSWYFNTLSPTTTEIAFIYFSPNVIIASSAAFLWLKQLKVPDIFEKPLAFLSSMTFPIYFMHLLIIEILKGGVLGFSISPYFIHPVVGILLLAVVTFSVSMLVTIVIRLIPHSSKVIG